MTVYENPLKEGLCRIVAESIRENGSETNLDTLFDGIIECTSAITESARQKDPPIKTLACDAGCSHCCHQYDVGVTPFEILRIAEFIQDTYSQAEREALLDRVGAAEQRKNQQPIEDWGIAKFPCPLLADDNCSVYEIRPLICRAMNSYSMKRCQSNRENPRDDSSVPMYGHQYEIAGFARAGVQRGLVEVNVQSELLELVPALKIALTTPGALLRWLTGERIFEGAVSRLPPRMRRAKRPSNDTETEINIEHAASVHSAA